MVSKLVGGAIIASLLGGCVSSLDVHRFDPNRAQVGYPYRLRMTQYKVTLTWRVISCGEMSQEGNKVKVLAEVTDSTDLDPTEFYVIDPRSLEGMFRTTEFKMDWYEDRTAKSITSSVDDQTGAPVANVVTAIASLARAPLVPFGANPNKCSTAVQASLKAIPALELAVDKAQRAVGDQTADLAALTARAASAGSALDGKTSKALGATQDRLAALNIILKLAQAKLKDQNDVLTDMRVVTWPEYGNEFETGAPVGPTEGALKRWNAASSSGGIQVSMRLVHLHWPDALAPPSTQSPEGRTPFAAAPADNGVDLSIFERAESNQGDTSQQNPVGGLKPVTPQNGRVLPASDARKPVTSASEAPKPASRVQPVAAVIPAPSLRSPLRPTVIGTGDRTLKSFPGLPYREPTRVLLLICRGSAFGDDTDALGHRLVLAKKGLALQGGPKLYAPFRSQTFASVKHAVGFSRGGVPMSAEASQLRSPGVGASGGFKDTATAVSGAVDAARGAETKRLTAAANAAKAKKALADAEAALAAVRALLAQP